jgi:hypothetical protein
MKTETIEPLVKNTITRERKPAASCCGGAPTDNKDACCKLDEDKKAEGASGCGCNTETTSKSSGCC